MSAVKARQIAQQELKKRQQEWSQMLQQQSSQFEATYGADFEAELNQHLSELDNKWVSKAQSAMNETIRRIEMREQTHKRSKRKECE